MQLNKLIEQRWSPRAFSQKPIESKKLDLLFEAARWAPSSMNEQPWRFVYATKYEPETWTKIFDTLVEANQVWATKAPVLIAIVAKSNFDYKNKPNKHAWYDSGQAVSNFLIQATELGLVAHQMGGFSTEKAIENLEIPDGHNPIAIMALGYQGNTEELPDDLQVREKAHRKRKAIEEFVFKGVWGNS